MRIKNKLILALLCALALLPLVFCSCGECTHTWDKGYTALQPTTTEKGYYIYTCIDCGEKRSEEIAKLTHVEHDYSKTTWGGDESYHWLVCDFDDCNVTTNKKEHTWVEKFGGGVICQVCRKEK